MYPQLKFTRAVLAILTCLLWATITPAAVTQAAPPAQTTANTTLIATQDVRLQGGSPDKGFNGYIWVGTPNGHLAFMQFDLTQLPADAAIDHADLVLGFTGNYSPTANVEIGYLDGPWDQDTVTWNTKPNAVFNGGPIQTIADVRSDITWDVTPVVARWQSGTSPNYGFALRGDGPLKQFYSTENHANGEPPRLVVTYTTPADTEPAHPDLGDAPDSTNHHGQPNTAYPGAGVLGQFPTVWQAPAGQIAGPRHDNETPEGILGQYISREREADQGPDQDGPNNILRNAAGAIGDVSNMDRGDDGWRNRSIRFFDCRKQTLTVRISKAPTATLKKMYLNVWFDGNRDGDWGDIARCQDPNGGPDQAAYEWIVQDYIVDMTAIPAGGYLDFNIDTERVLNSSGGLPHWMRFTLSEERTVQPPNGDFPDGRGPHPDSAQKSYRFGETEDILQKPPRPEETDEPGQLILEKRVLPHEDPVDYPGEVTYQIRLRQAGGSGPVAAQIRDQIGFPQHLLPRITQDGSIAYVEVTSATGGASPLEAGLSYVNGDVVGTLEQLISWDGTLEPDSEVLLTFDIHVHPYCPALLQTKTITNVARARLIDGDPISAETAFQAKCPGYDAEGGIQIDPEPIDYPIDRDDWTHVPWQGAVWNKHPVSVTLGFYQQFDNPNNTGAGVSAAAVAGPNKNGRRIDQTTPLLARVALAPDEHKLIDLVLRMESEFSDEVALADDFSPIGKLMFCILPAEEDKCADAAEYPNMVGEVPGPNFIPRPDDLGDAPDSTNHFGAAMTAYAGVQANFPTVFDPAVGNPQGPKHHHPRHLHLGPAVSREAEADIGPDADGVHNITPPANTADQDWFDDGARLSNLADCQPARADVQVEITPQLANLFAALEKKAYLNIWLDMNHDGDWEDGFTCVDTAGQNKVVVEHLLIDYPIDVVGLGAGLHALTNIITREAIWPAALVEEPRWVRFTLSERQSNKPLTFGGVQYGDGRGFAAAFKVGETEDYLRHFNGQGQAGPDMALRMAGKIVPAEQGGKEMQLKFDYANLGAAEAQGARLTLDKQILNVDVEIRSVQGPGLQSGDVTSDGNNIIVALPTLAPNQSSSIAMRLGLPGAQQAMAATVNETYTLTAQIELADDIDLSNNQARLTFATATTPLRLAASVESDDLLRKADTTCRDEVWLQGLGEPMQHVDLYVNDASNIQLQFDADGRIIDARLTNLPEGRNLIWIDYPGSAVQSPRDVASGQAVRLAVDTGLPVDPITLLLTNSQGRSYHPNTFGWSRGADSVDRWRLRNGETYEISILTCVDDPNLLARLFMNNELLSTLRDDDGDGLYTGSFTYSAPEVSAASVDAAAEVVSQLRLVVDAGGTEQSFDAEVTTQEQGAVRDAASGQPVADAAVTALVNDGAGFSAITAVESSEPAAQTTGADGLYGFEVADGTYRLAVTHSGYQPYRTGDIAVDNGSLATEINLSPAIADVANHIVHITANGFEPAVVNAQPGDVILWVNSDLAAHAINGASWDSGLLAIGESYKARLTDKGAFAYTDGANGLLTGTVVVAEAETPGGSDEVKPVYLPLIWK
ncbi:MAG: DNRLRE domain-containing protein [Caldilineaceae bacterium]